MSTEKLIRWSGLVAMVTGIVIMAFNLAAAINLVSAGVQNVRTFVTTTLLVFAFIGLYAGQHQPAGRLGLIGFVMAELGLIMNIGLRFIDVLISPYLIPQFPDAVQAVTQGPYFAVVQMTFAIFGVGYILFGIATLRAATLPKGAAWLLIAGAVISYVGVWVMLPINIGSLLANAGIAWMGWALWSGKTQNAQQLQPAMRAS